MDRDAFIEREVERAMAPYRGLLPPEALAAMREMLADMLATHPVASRLVARLTSAPVVTSSGEVDKDREQEPSTLEEARAGDGVEKRGGGR